jgi:8-oxo-dGTP pyrophosphatase MutT (NUDIX family)
MNQSAKPVRWAVAVYALVRNASGQVLLLRRHDKKNHFPGCWELPGGKPVRDEDIDTTALLEVIEESGLHVDLTGVAGAADGSVPGVRVAAIILEARTRQTKVTLSDEHDEFRWLPLEKVASLKLRPGFDQFFADYTHRCLSQKKPAPRKSAQ